MVPKSSRLASFQKLMPLRSMMMATVASGRGSTTLTTYSAHTHEVIVLTSAVVYVRMVRGT